MYGGFRRIDLSWGTTAMLATLSQFRQRLYSHIYNLNSAFRASDIAVEKIFEIRVF
jgi:hypothetical protein